MDDLKKIIVYIVKRNIIVDKGKNGNESFYLTTEITADADLLDNEDDDIESLSEIETFINDKCYHVSHKSEIKSALNDKTSLANSIRINPGDSSIDDNKLNSLNDANPIITST